MRRKLGFKPTLREQRESANKGLRHYELLTGRPTPAGLMNEIAPKRERAAPVSREGPVVAAISELLAVHPKVLFAVRQNTGSASYEANSGKWAPVTFYRLVTHSPKVVTITDFWGLLKDGRMFACEAKEPFWRGPGEGASETHQRERRQAMFLAMVRSTGGIGLFATEAAQVAEALK